MEWSKVGGVMMTQFRHAIRGLVQYLPSLHSPNPTPYRNQLDLIRSDLI